MPPERLESVLAAIFFVLSLIASNQGIPPSKIEKYAGEVYAIRPRKFRPLTQEEQEMREDEEIRRAFAGSLMRIKAALLRKQKNKRS